MTIKRDKRGSRTQGVNPAYEMPVRTPSATDAERKTMECNEILAFADNVNVFAQSDEVPRQFWKLDLKSLKAICAEWKAIAIERRPK